MNKYIYLFLSFIVLALFDFYLKENIGGLGEGSNDLTLLVVCVFIGCLLVIWTIISSSSIFVKYSIGFLVLFFTYFALRVVIDVGSLKQLKAYTVASSGGIIFFYSMGLLLSILLNQLALADKCVSQRYLKILTVTIFLSLVISFMLVFNVFSDLAIGLRRDLFLIADVDGHYQRAGDFLTISFLVNTTVYMRLISLNQQCHNSIYRVLKYIFFFTYIGNSAVSMVLAQMIGSNNATVSILGLSIIFLATLLLIRSNKIRYYINNHKLSIKKIVLGGIGRRVFSLLVISVLLSFVFIITISKVLGIDILSFRLMGFGAGEVSSINSRLELLRNFIPQFTDSPLIGNMNVAAEMTGDAGAYVHSFMLSLLTHVGIFGATLLLIYIGFSYNGIFKTTEKTKLLSFFQSDNLYLLYSLITISFIFLIATAATFITWPVVWFAMGLFFVVIRFEKRLIHE
jgi:hypothetical protein